MKLLLSSTLALSLLFSNVAFAECDFKTIQKVENGYLYSKECHIKVGKTVQDLEKRELQVKELYKTIELKDLAITKSHERIDLWMNTSFKLEDRVNTIDRMQSTNKWLYFGLGIVVMGLAVHGAGQLR